MSAPPDLPREGAVLGVDYGTVRIGLALGDLASGLVLPLPVLPNPGTVEGAITRLEEVARGRSAVTVVLGDPVFASGVPSPMSLTIARVADELARRLGVPVLRRDERLTSVNAEETLAAQGLRWWQYSKGQVDTLAAMTLVRELLIERDPELGKVREEDPGEPAQPDRTDKADRRRRHQKRRRGDDAGEA